MHRHFEDNNHSQQQLIHGTYRPAPVRRGERIVAQLVVNPKEEPHPCDVWQLSPNGIELLGPLGLQVALNQRLRVVLEIAGQKLEKQGLTISVTSKDKRPYLGLKFDPTTDHQPRDTSLLSTLTMWTCDPLFCATGSLENPVRFNDIMRFRIIRLSHQELVVVTSLRNKILLSDLELSGQAYLPNCGTLDFLGRIISTDTVTLENKQYARVRLKMSRISKAKKKLLGNYILRFCSHDNKFPSPKVLRNEGYGSIDMSDAVEFDYVQTEKDYRQVLKLRSDAFRAETHLGVTKDADGMSDEYDARARIIMAKFRGQVVGTVRVCFHGPNDFFEEEAYTKLPDNLPPREQMVEASRAATHPDFRSNDLFINMMRFTMLTVLQSHRRWLLQSTFPYLIPVYERIGFKSLNVKVPHRVFPGQYLVMLLADAHSVATARSGNPFLYQALVPHIEQFLASDHFNQLSWGEKKKLSLYKKSAPLFKLFTKYTQIKSDTHRAIKIAMKR